MLVRSPSFEDFEGYLERVLDRAAPDDPNRALIRDHFGIDDPAAKRGKRLRPRILLAVAESEGSDGRAALGAAAALELLHNFSLIHDDIEDGDAQRYGEKTLHEEHGTPVALNVGDLLIGEGYRLLADCRASAEQKAAMIRVAAEGQRELCTQPWMAVARLTGERA